MRAFRAEDGTEISEDDIRELAEVWGSPGKPDGYSYTRQVAQAVRDALKPKTCGARMKNYDERGVSVLAYIGCVLPPGHHRYSAVLAGPCVESGCPDRRAWWEPVHIEHHACDQSLWSES